MDGAVVESLSGVEPTTTVELVVPERPASSPKPTSINTNESLPAKNLVTLMFHRPLKTVPPEGIRELVTMLQEVALDIEKGEHLGTRDITVPDQWEVVRRDGTAWVKENPQVFDEALKIPGWYSRSRLEQLALLALSVLEPRARFMEIGTWKGRSAYVLASVLKLAKQGSIDCVDTFAGLPEVDDARYHSEEDILGAASLNLADLPVSFIQVNSSTQIQWLFTPERGSYSLIHVDGDHTYPVCEMDIFNGWWLLKPGGVLCGDDYDEVKASVDRLARAMNTKVYVFEEKLWWTYR